MCVLKTYLDIPYSRLLQVPGEEHGFLNLEEFKPHQLSEFEILNQTAAASGASDIRFAQNSPNLTSNFIPNDLLCENQQEPRSIAAPTKAVLAQVSTPEKVCSHAFFQVVNSRNHILFASPGADLTFSAFRHNFFLITFLVSNSKPVAIPTATSTAPTASDRVTASESRSNS